MQPGGAPAPRRRSHDLILLAALAAADAPLEPALPGPAVTETRAVELRQDDWTPLPASSFALAGAGSLGVLGGLGIALAVVGGALPCSGSFCSLGNAMPGVVVAMVGVGGAIAGRCTWTLARPAGTAGSGPTLSPWLKFT